MKEFLPGTNIFKNALTLSIYYYYKDWLTWCKEISLYFYEVTQTRRPPFCFECMIALVKADKFPINKFETALLVFRGHLFLYLGPLSLCAQKCFRLLRTSGLYNCLFRDKLLCAGSKICTYMPVPTPNTLRDDHLSILLINLVLVMLTFRTSSAIY